MTVCHREVLSPCFRSRDAGLRARRKGGMFGTSFRQVGDRSAPVPPGVWPPSSGETAVGPGLVKRKCEVGPSEGTWAAGRERGAGPAPLYPPRLFCSQTELRPLCLTWPPFQDGGRPGRPSECAAPGLRSHTGQKLGHQIDKAERP